MCGVGTGARVSVTSQIGSPSLAHPTLPMMPQISAKEKRFGSKTCPASSLSFIVVTVHALLEQSLDCVYIPPQLVLTWRKACQQYEATV